MEKIIAACGKVCSDCEAYRATKANDSEAITRIAQEWREAYDPETQPEQVWCDGCMTKGRKCGHTECGCVIRACAGEQGLAICSACTSYPCAEIVGFHTLVSQARETLDILVGEQERTTACKVHCCMVS